MTSFFHCRVGGPACGWTHPPHRVFLPPLEDMGSHLLQNPFLVFVLDSSAACMGVGSKGPFQESIPPPPRYGFSSHVSALILDPHHPDPRRVWKLGSGARLATAFPRDNRDPGNPRMSSETSIFDNPSVDSEESLGKDFPKVLT